MFKNIELRDIVLGGQDGLVNVLGLSLGLFAAHSDARTIIVAGLAAGLSEAVSMAAVAYTSSLVDKNRFDLENQHLFMSSITVLFAALIGSLIPLSPFLFLSIGQAMITAVIFSAIVLFLLGVFKAKKFGGNWFASGGLIVVIGIFSAFAGFVIGLFLKVK